MMVQRFRGFPALFVLGCLAMGRPALAEEVVANRTLAPAQAPPSVQKDGIRDGAIKGALIGALATGISAAVIVANSGACPCKDNDPVVMRSAAIGAGIGAGVGILLDSLMYRRSTVSIGPATMALGPAVAQGSLGVSGRVRW